MLLKICGYLIFISHLRVTMSGCWLIRLLDSVLYLTLVAFQYLWKFEKRLFYRKLIPVIRVYICSLLYVFSGCLVMVRVVGLVVRTLAQVNLWWSQQILCITWSALRVSRVIISWFRVIDTVLLMVPSYVNKTIQKCSRSRDTVSCRVEEIRKCNFPQRWCEYSNRTDLSTFVFSPSNMCLRYYYYLKEHAQQCDSYSVKVQNVIQLG